MQTKHISKKRMAKPWLAPELLKLIKAKSLYFKLSRVGIVSHEFNLNYRNKLNSFIRRSKNKYFLDSSPARCRGDMSITWELIRGALSQGLSDRSMKSLIILEC